MKSAGLLPIMWFVVLFCWCQAFILLSSSVGFKTSNLLFEPGTGYSYQITSTVVLNEPAERKGKDVGYQIRGDVSLAVLWHNPEAEEKLLELKLNNPKLLIQSTKNQVPNSFEEHKSYLDNKKSYPLLIHWKNGRILHVYLDKREDTSLANLKKGIASLFQSTESETKETDASGECLVEYTLIDVASFGKTKKDCFTSTESRRRRKNSDPLLSGNVTSSRTSTYKLSNSLTTIESVTTFENHDFVLGMKREVGCSVSATQHLILTGNSFAVQTSKSSSLENAVEEIANAQKLDLRKSDLQLETFSPNCEEEDCPSLPKLLKENRIHLSDSNLGTHKSAAAFVKLLSVARTATKADMMKAFKGSKNKEILNQLCDLAGAIQSQESHEVIMKLINFDAEKDFDVSERYLWALATSSHPSEAVLADIFKISERSHTNEKLDETIVLTLASMAKNLYKTTKNKNSSLLHSVVKSIKGELEICKDEECKIKYIRAMRNLNCPSTLGILVRHALNGKLKTRVEAMKALRSFEPSQWTEEVLDAAQRIYFQAGRRYDSSSRTLAVDILLESKPSREVLKELLLTLVHHDPTYEVKRYLDQRVKQISEKNKNFAELVNSIKHEFVHLFNNYHVEAQRGLTTAFGKNFANSEYRNGTLSTVLEISKGLLKRGVVDVVVESSEKSTSLLTLGLFAGGLSSFVSSNEDQEKNDAEEDDVATAGMELTVLGSQIRPFVFFSGQGELMGHVWSGTASEKTPAYQAIILAIDFFDHVALQNGFLVEIEALGAVSFDLSGQIQISLWNKNAYSLVQKSAGISLRGGMRVDSSFARSTVDFNVATEMKLDLQSDLNFYGGNSLCMQLSQPEVVIKHNVHKIERIPGGKHRLRRSKYSQSKVPGRTYALNKKNNEMCNVIFS
ncbi:hypothetical protein RUM43_002232 [Polyplax serrata]|uniref:Vitellogenin domain-containing protein n=1 Tax=Polyplax serrata TaxID=468196 RepID=A0AAN8P208_POLSC